GESPRRQAPARSPGCPATPAITPADHRPVPCAPLRRSRRALRAAHGALPWTAGTIGHPPRPALTGRPLPPTTQLPEVNAAPSITITGIGDHHRPESTITFTRIRL